MLFPFAYNVDEVANLDWSTSGDISGGVTGAWTLLDLDGGGLTESDLDTIRFISIVC